MLQPKFVEHIPEVMHDGVLYISIPYRTAIHKCCCGCGREVVTPLSPQGWRLIFDGVSVSLYPSIGNWQFECRSHYWVVENQVQWADRRTSGARGRQAVEAVYFSKCLPPQKRPTRIKSAVAAIWLKLTQWLSKLGSTFGRS